jgi:hypothetical protein
MLEVTGDASSEDERRENNNNSELENDNDHGALNVSGKSVAYNKREMYFTNHEMIIAKQNDTIFIFRIVTPRLYYHPKSTRTKQGNLR